MMKKIFSLLLALTLLVTAMTVSFAEEEKDLLGRIQERGTIIIATEGTWAPWTYHDENDKRVGFDVEVAEKIAEKLGVAVDWEEVAWDGIFSGIDAGRYDITVNGVDVTEARSEKYDFTVPYGYVRTAIIVRGDNDSITSFEDLKGKKTANTLASTYAELAESYGANPIGVDDLNQTIELLLAGRVDATLNAEVSLYDFMQVRPDANIKLAALSQEANHVAIPLRKGEDNATLLAAINQAITELHQEGVIADLSMKYFGLDITQAPVAAETAE